MTNYEKKENRLLKQIEKLLESFDDTMEDADREGYSDKAYEDQARAVGQLDAILRKEDKLQRVYAEAETEGRDAPRGYASEDDAPSGYIPPDSASAGCARDQAAAEERIRVELAKLDKILGKLEGTDSRVMAYIEQKKALHQIKRIVREAQKLDA